MGTNEERVCCDECGAGEVVMAGVRGWVLAREDGVAVRFIVNKLALVQVAKKLF